MYRLILVDDEPWALMGLEEIIPWQEYGFEICGRCSSAERALAEICELKPDAVITDIRMPRLTGIEMISRVREQKLDVEFLIVSAFTDFEVARKAIDYGAVGYVLKPLNVEEVIHSVKRLKDRLDQKAFHPLLTVDPNDDLSVKQAVAKLREYVRSLRTCFFEISEGEIAALEGWNSIPFSVVGEPHPACFWFSSAADATPPNGVGRSNPRPDELELSAMVREAIASFRGGFIYSSHHTIATVQSYLGTHYSENLSIARLASQVYLSETYLCDLFKKNTGETILNFLHKLRLNNACRLLKESNLSIKEISLAVGFSDYNYFGRIFRRQIGETPERYRNRFAAS